MAACGRRAWVVGWHCTLCGAQGECYAKDKNDEKDKNDKGNGRVGAMARDFSAAQGSRRGHGRRAVGGMALCSPRRGHVALHFPAAWYTHILCHVLCVLYVLFVLFPALSIGFAHCVLPTNPIFFQNGYDTYFPENRHFSKNFLQVLEVAGKAIRYTVLKDKSPYWQ